MPLDPLPDWVPIHHRAIGDRIRAAREYANLTQLQLAERIGREHKTISKFEHAISVPNLTDLLLIAHAVDVPLAELVREPSSADGPRTGLGPASPRRET